MKTTIPTVPCDFGLLFCFDWETPTVSEGPLQSMWCKLSSGGASVGSTPQQAQQYVCICEERFSKQASKKIYYTSVVSAAVREQYVSAWEDLKSGHAHTPPPDSIFIIWTWAIFSKKLPCCSSSWFLIPSLSVISGSQKTHLTHRKTS